MFEGRARHPLLGEESLVEFESFQRARLAYDDALAHDRQVGQVLVELRRATEGGLVEAVDDVTRLLKLDGEEESRTRVNALDLAARRVRAARLDVVRPEL